MTVGELRKALEGAADDTVVLAYSSQPFLVGSYHVPSIRRKKVGPERFWFEPDGEPQPEGTPYIIIS